MAAAKTGTARTGTAKTKTKRARTAPKRAAARPTAKKRATAKRPSPPHARRHPPQRTVTPVPTVTDENEASAAREEKHGMIEEAIEPPPSRGGQDIERE
jgi:hypothetical protein